MTRTQTRRETGPQAGAGAARSRPCVGHQGGPGARHGRVLGLGVGDSIPHVLHSIPHVLPDVQPCHGARTRGKALRKEGPLGVLGIGGLGGSGCRAMLDGMSSRAMMACPAGP